MTELFNIVYVSTATAPMGAADLEFLLMRARHHNAGVGVTGMLLYDDGHFMQYLEGQASGLAAALARIRGSSQHGGIVELLRERVSRREFPAWEMAFRSPQAFAMSDPRAQSTQLAPPGADLDVTVSSAATLLLARFWHRGRYQRLF